MRLLDGTSVMFRTVASREPGKYGFSFLVFKVEVGSQKGAKGVGVECINLSPQPKLGLEL